MNVYGNQTSKIYPDINTVAPSSQETNPQNYRMSKISKVETYLLDDISKREKLAKNNTFSFHFKCYWH